MQKEINAMTTAKSVVIVGLNPFDRANANDMMCDGRDLPWLQDTEQVKAWDLWQHEYRDVVIVDADNKLVSRFNLTNQDLADSTHYNALRDRLVAAAQ